MPADLQWTALEWPGLEHVVASADADGFRADSQLIAGPPPGPARVSYQLRCDASWRFTALTITVTGAAGSRTLDLTASQDGRWLADGHPRRDLDGCADIDISLTPLTNTLPFRADLTVDGDGSVTCYPGLWRRVDPGAGAAAWGPSSRRARTRVARRR